MKTRHAICTAMTAAALATSSSGVATAQMSNSASYNSPYGMTQANENQTVDPSLRDSNGNLSVVNGQFTSSAMSQQSGVQGMSSLGTGGSGVGFSTPASNSTATAIGNQLNVVTVGNWNTVVVNAQQTNNGNQTATVDGH